MTEHALSLVGLNSDRPLDGIDAMQNQIVVGRASARHVGLKPDLRPNGLSCFKAYNIRGRVPDELNEDIAWRIGRAFAAELKPHSVIVGRDVRLESLSLTASLSKRLNDGGADVIDIGLCGTEEVYFQTFHRQVDGGIMVTASHNPKGYNGMKLVREGSRPVSGDSGLFAIRDRAESNDFSPRPLAGEGEDSRRVDPDKTAYIGHLLSYIDRSIDCLEEFTFFN